MLPGQKSMIESKGVLITEPMYISKSFYSTDQNSFYAKNCGCVLLWFTDYFEGRRHKDVKENCLSNIALVFTGAPQGSVLGPILLTILNMNMIAMAVKRKSRWPRLRNGI